MFFVLVIGGLFIFLLLSFNLWWHPYRALCSDEKGVLPPNCRQVHHRGVTLSPGSILIYKCKWNWIDSKWLEHQSTKRVLYLNSLEGIVSKGDTKCCLMFSYTPGKMTHFLLLREYATLAFHEHTKKLKHPHETNKQSTRRETYDNPDNPLCPVFSIERYNYINRFVCWPSWLLMGNTTAQKKKILICFLLQVHRRARGHQSLPYSVKYARLQQKQTLFPLKDHNFETIWYISLHRHKKRLRP